MLRRLFIYYGNYSIYGIYDAILIEPAIRRALGWCGTASERTRGRTIHELCVLDLLHELPLRTDRAFPRLREDPNENQ